MWYELVNIEHDIRIEKQFNVSQMCMCSSTYSPELCECMYAFFLRFWHFSYTDSTSNKQCSVHLPTTPNLVSSHREKNLHGCMRLCVRTYIALSATDLVVALASCVLFFLLFSSLYFFVDKPYNFVILVSFIRLKYVWRHWFKRLCKFMWQLFRCKNCEWSRIQSLA